MPLPTGGLLTTLNPNSTNVAGGTNANGVTNTTAMNLPFFKRTDKPWFTGTFGTASTTYVISNPSADAEPCTIMVNVDGLAEYGLFAFHGASVAITKIAGSTNVVTTATPGATQISLWNNSGTLEIRTGSGTIIGSTAGAIHIKRLD